MARITEEKLHTLVRSRQPKVVAVGDGSGLCLRITATCASWVLRYRIDNRAHWLTLGQFEDVGLKDAKKKATAARAKINEGVDPIAEKRRTRRQAEAARAALRAAKTFRDLSRDYMERAGPDLAESTHSDREWMLKEDILPRIGDLRLEEITGADIVRLVESIGKRSKVMARKAFSVTSVIFSHGVGKHLCTSNPCSSVRVRTVLGKKKPVREGKALTEAELRILLPKVDGIGRSNSLALRIILTTAVRKVEMRLARWEHLDLDTGLWTIPSENSKNSKAFTIPLPQQVVEWFRELQTRACGCKWVLPGQNHRDPVSESMLNAAVCRLTLDGVRHFSIHDLRRTARSLLGMLGVDIIVAEKCLNHTLGGLVDVYDRGSYVKERREAVEKLTRFVVACEDGPLERGTIAAGCLIF